MTSINRSLCASLAYTMATSCAAQLHLCQALAICARKKNKSTRNSLIRAPTAPGTRRLLLGEAASLLFAARSSPELPSEGNHTYVIRISQLAAYAADLWMSLRNDGTAATRTARASTACRRHVENGRANLVRVQCQLLRESTRESQAFSHGIV